MTQLVEVNRRPLDPDRLQGFLVAESAGLTMLHVIDDQQYRMNGYAVFRNADVRKRRVFEAGDFLHRAASLHRLRPVNPEVGIGTMREAIASAGAQYPLVTLFRERRSRGTCEIGRLVRTSQRTATLLSISPTAEWEGFADFAIRDVTLLQFGGAYERLLWRMAK